MYMYIEEAILILQVGFVRMS